MGKRHFWKHLCPAVPCGFAYAQNLRGLRACPTAGRAQGREQSPHRAPRAQSCSSVWPRLPASLRSEGGRCLSAGAGLHPVVTVQEWVPVSSARGPWHLRALPWPGPWTSAPGKGLNCPGLLVNFLQLFPLGPFALV